MRFMKQAFGKVFDSVSREKPLPNSTKPLQELIQQALLEIAHTVDSQFDSLNAKCEKLEGKLEKAQKKTETIAKATAQENLRMDEAAVDVFAQCIEAVKAEVRQRKEEQIRKLNSAETKSLNTEKQGAPERKGQDSVQRRYTG